MDHHQAGPTSSLLTCEHGQRAVCCGALICDLLDDVAAEVEAMVEVGFRGTVG